MTPLQAFLAAYVPGIICVTGTVAPLIAQARRRKPGRHRATGQSTDQQMRRTPGYVNATHPIPATPAPLEFPHLHEATTDIAPLCPPMRPVWNSSGVGRYAHLRIEELDATAEQKLRRRGLGETPVVDLQALRVRGSVPTVAEVDDEWYAEVMAS